MQSSRSLRSLGRFAAALLRAAYCGVSNKNMEYQIGKNFVDTKGTRIALKGKRIFLNDVTSPKDVSEFNKYVSWITHNPETKRVIIYLQQKFRIFPNVFVPIAVAIEFLRKRNIKVILHNDIEDFDETNFFNPLLATKENMLKHKYSSGIVWKVTTSEEINNLIEAVIFELSNRLICEPGVLLSLEWSINEMLDNIFQHSNTHIGYFMYQFQESYTRISFCLGDFGIGIYHSLQGSRYKPISPADAITLAITEGVTRYEKQTRGNGLWGVSELIAKNLGQLTITSGGAAIYFNKATGEVTTFEDVTYLDKNETGTTIDVQVNPASSIDINSALKRCNAIVNLRLEDMENEYGDISIKIRDRSEGVGTRESGQNLRNFIRNTLNESNGTLLIDFSGLGIISSSYADEAFGDLYTQIGKKEFSRRIRFNGLTDTIKLILQNTFGCREE